MNSPEQFPRESIFHERTRSQWTILIIVLLFATAVVSMLEAQTSLSVGDVQVLGVTSDANDSFSFVLWKDIASGTVIRFMDQSFTNATTGVLGTENDMSLTFNSALTAGTVIRVEDTGTTLVNNGAFVGTKTGSLSGISASGDQVFIYQGTAMGTGTSFTGRTLLYGMNVADTNWISTGTADSNTSYLPTAINGLDNNVDSGNFDNAGYGGARTGMTAAAYRAAVGNVTNYVQSDTRFDLTTTGFTVAGSASLHWDADGTGAGVGGAGTWDATTQSRFRNGAGGTTYFHWVNSSTGNDHTAVFGGTASTVSVAVDGVTASGLQFDVNGYTIANNIVTLGGSSPTVVVTNASEKATISSTLGGVGFTKSGAGVLVLAGTNTYTGTTTVSGGVLQVGSGGTGDTGADAMNITGGTLTGTGTVKASSVTLSNGTKLAAGDVTGLGVTGRGTLTFTPVATGTYNIASGADVLLDILPGGTSDKLVFNGSAGSTFVFNGGLTVGPATLTPTAVETFDLLDWSAFITPTFAAHFPTNLLRDGSVDNGTDFDLPNISGSGFAWDISSFTSNGSIAIVVVPEPGRAAMVLAGMLVLLRNRKRHNTSSPCH